MQLVSEALYIYFIPVLLPLGNPGSRYFFTRAFWCFLAYLLEVAHSIDRIDANYLQCCFSADQEESSHGLRCR